MRSFRGKLRGGELNETWQPKLWRAVRGAIGSSHVVQLLDDARRLLSADATAREIGTNSRRCIGVAMDVADEKQVDDGVARTVAAFGRLDILVSNAGIQIVHLVEEFSYAEWKKMLAIHVDGAFLTTKACLPHMYKAGSGSVMRRPVGETNTVSRTSASPVAQSSARVSPSASRSRSAPVVRPSPHVLSRGKRALSTHSTEQPRR